MPAGYRQWSGHLGRGELDGCQAAPTLATRRDDGLDLEPVSFAGPVKSYLSVAYQQTASAAGPCMVRRTPRRRYLRRSRGLPPPTRVRAKAIHATALPIRCLGPHKDGPLRPSLRQLLVEQSATRGSPLRTTGRSRRRGWVNAGRRSSVSLQRRLTATGIDCRGPTRRRGPLGRANCRCRGAGRSSTRMQRDCDG